MKRKSTLPGRSERPANDAPPPGAGGRASPSKHTTKTEDRREDGKFDFEVQEEALRRRAAERVAPWGKVQKSDYDFSSWMEKEELLEAGCIYEYARESRKLRGLLVLMNPGRKRESFEIERLSRTGKLRYRPCSFEGLKEEAALRALGGALYWLRGYAQELATNMSFAELLRVKGDEVKRSLKKRPLHFPLKAVDLAFTYFWDSPGPPPWPWQPWSSLLFLQEEGSSLISIPERRIPEDGIETIAIEVNWAANKQKREKELARVLRALEPPGWEKPKRKREEKVFRARLNALAVLRIRKRFARKEDRWKRIEEVGRCTGYKSCVDVFQADGAEDVDGAKAAMSRARGLALSFFQGLGTGEVPANFC